MEVKAGAKRRVGKSEEEKKKYKKKEKNKLSPVLSLTDSVPPAPQSLLFLSPVKIVRRRARIGWWWLHYWHIVCCGSKVSSSQVSFPSSNGETLVKPTSSSTSCSSDTEKENHTFPLPL
jgi:hypothetical protein